MSHDPRGYELLDLRDGAKLERFGGVTLIRAAPAARGPSALDSGAWAAASAEFRRTGSSGQWRRREPIPEPWIVRSAGFEYVLELAPAGQVGLYPEQAPMRERVSRRIRDRARGAQDPPRVLDLFASSGGGTMAAARAGASVTYVDALRSSVARARRNAEQNGLGASPIRYIPEHVPRFCAREIRRGNRYEAVLLDPPSFGRGPQGEMWRIEADLDSLLDDCRQLLSDSAAFVLLTAHTRSWKAAELGKRLDRAFGDLPGASRIGELVLTARSAVSLPSGLFALRSFHD